MTDLQRATIIKSICKALCLEDRGDTEGWEGYSDLAESVLSAIERFATVQSNPTHQTAGE